MARGGAGAGAGGSGAGVGPSRTGGLGLVAGGGAGVVRPRLPPAVLPSSTLTGAPAADGLSSSAAAAAADPAGDGEPASKAPKLALTSTAGAAAASVAAAVAGVARTLGGPGLPLTTPSLGGASVRSRLGLPPANAAAAGGASVPAAAPAAAGSSAAAPGGVIGHGPLPATTPSLSKMRSAGGPGLTAGGALLGGGAGGAGLSAPTPAFNPFLPKTPAVGGAGGASAASRRPKRGEVVYAVSENGSPLGQLKCVVACAHAPASQARPPPYTGKTFAVAGGHNSFVPRRSRTFHSLPACSTLIAAFPPAPCGRAAPSPWARRPPPPATRRRPAPHHHPRRPRLARRPLSRRQRPLRRRTQRWS